ncbi:MAG: PadR family transcriptional regulator [Flexilinea flocculi]|nr:PadR family transcriptional regulator [Flexilinea flocculi]
MSVRYAILGLLAQHPSHGYELHAAILALAGGGQDWDLKPAQVYTTLNRLEKNGFVQKTEVQQDGGPERQIYAITANGKEELAEWFTNPSVGDHQRDDFFLKLMTALISTDINPSWIIQKQRMHLLQELHRATAQRDQYNPKSEMAQILFQDKMIMHLEADIRWLEMIEVRLEEIKKQPFPEPDVRPRGRPKKNTD